MLRDWKGPYRRRLARKLSDRGCRMARARWDRYHAEHPAIDEPKMQRYYPFEFACRHKATGEVAWHDLVSVRHAARALGLVLKAFECPTPYRRAGVWAGEVYL